MTLPPRVDMTERDAVKFHATADGYLSEERSFDAQKVPDKVVIELHALPNNLVFLGHTELAGRTSLVMRTTEQPEVRMSKNTSLQGFQIALTKTALKLEGKPPKGGGHLTGLDAVQLGEDSIVRVGTDAPNLEVRSKQSFDPVQPAVRVRVRHRGAGRGRAVRRADPRAARRAPLRAESGLRPALRRRAARAGRRRGAGRRVPPVGRARRTCTAKRR